MYETWIGNRYVRSRSSNHFVSLISLISMLGIAIAVAVLIIVLSVVNGFERELQDRLLAMTGHASIEGANQRLADWPGLAAVAAEDPRVVASAPYIDGQALLIAGRSLSGAALRGIDPSLERQVSGIDKVTTNGDIGSLEPGAFRIAIGVELARELGVSLGDKVTVTLAEGRVTPLGVIPRSKRFTVSSIYRVGMYEFDRRLGFINLEDARRLFRKGNDVSGLRLAVNDVFRAPEIVRDVAVAGGGGVLVSDWTRRHVNFFRSIQITKSILFVILLMVVAVAAFNIVSTLVMVVKDKQSDIAILRTVGAAPSSIMRIFMTQGTVIGVVGTAAGLVLGVLLTINLENLVGFFEATFGIKFLAADVYFISDLPADLRWPDVARVCGIALALALFSTVYPAWRGARTSPAEALRHD
ncbi:MAG: lipoprotein-releasing ABC transporter permease subunit [Woeseia sp.]|nr:lipoprotein-releasing ABC transporter permease subunit [Woeseia sp.]MBT8097075.1 lipoprotein-releasing ABC transporter permease subunit [Woeseia sp.]NNE62069.1 lipoprotein-releasing ABC transporter permease subunit [Woeseia sp.]NNL53680.1 lipoprotein-releasing ABC transporter permease subunit [Woeseia sp.]